MKSSEETMPSILYFIGRLIAYQPFWSVLCILLLVLWHGWPLILGVLARVFFDTLEGRAPDGLTLGSVVALVMALGLARVGTVYGSILAWVPLIFKSQGLLRRNLLARILERPGASAVPGSVGEAISTLRDDVEAMGEAAGWVSNTAAGVIFTTGGIAILLYVDAQVTLLVFIPIALVIILSHVARVRLERVREQSREATARVTGSIGEIFSTVQAINVACAEDRVIAHLRRLSDERQRAMLRDRLLNLALEALFTNTASLGAGLTLLVTASAMRSGVFTVGDFALFATYLMQVARYTQFFGYLINTYRQSRVSFKRAVALLQGAPAPSLVTHHPLYLRGPLPALTPSVKKEGGDRLSTLEVVGLTFRYPESGRGIEDISFKLERGSFTVITGRIGSGKTTLLRAILGLLEPQAGEMYWNGCKIEYPADFLVPPRVAYTPQVPTLLSGTLRENILLGLSNEGDRLMRAVRSAVLERDVAGFPDGLKTVIGARGMKLSGGQIQRTAAARMFVREPELLVLDDLSSALDVETEHILWQRVFERGTTCLVTSHRRAVLEKADQILILGDGRITAQGRLEDLLKTNAEMQRLCAGKPSTSSQYPATKILIC